MNKNLLIVGAGQYGMLANEIAENMGIFDKIEFLNDNNTVAIGKIAEYKDLIFDYSYAFVAVGDTDFRLNMIKKMQAVGYQLVTLISANAYISPSAEIGDGCIIEPNVKVQTSVKIGEGCLISARAVVNHNATIESGCRIDCNATVTVRSVVKAKTKIESGQVYKSEAINV